MGNCNNSTAQHFLFYRGGHTDIVHAFFEAKLKKQNIFQFHAKKVIGNLICIYQPLAVEELVDIFQGKYSLE